MPRSAAALYVVVVALVVAAIPTQADSGFTFSEEDLVSDDTLWALYERWAGRATYYGVVRDHGEMVRRFPIFKDSVFRIRTRDNKQELWGMNIFGDRTLGEVPTGLIESPPDVYCSLPGATCDKDYIQGLLLELPAAPTVSMVAALDVVVAAALLVVVAIGIKLHACIAGQGGIV